MGWKWVEQADCYVNCYVGTQSLRTGERVTAPRVRIPFSPLFIGVFAEVPWSGTGSNRPTVTLEPNLSEAFISYLDYPHDGVLKCVIHVGVIIHRDLHRRVPHKLVKHSCPALP